MDQRWQVFDAKIEFQITSGLSARTWTPHEFFVAAVTSLVTVVADFEINHCYLNIKIRYTSRHEINKNACMKEIHDFSQANFWLGLSVLALARQSGRQFKLDNAAAIITRPPPIQEREEFTQDWRILSDMPLHGKLMEKLHMEKLPNTVLVVFSDV